MLVAADVLLRARDTTTALRRLARPGRSGRGLDPSLALAAVQRAGRVTRAQCLAQSVALAALLVRSGQDAEVVLGCHRYAAGQWGAHAWVDCAGEKLEPVPAGPHDELARCAARERWVPAAVPPSATGRC